MAITLKAARVNKGLSQIEAAKMLNLAVETLRNYETGKSYPNVAVVKRIEDLYGVSYSEINFLPSTTV